ncbi:MAG: hypothetical protein R3C04_09990 [Hyphomonas sp.]
MGGILLFKFPPLFKQERKFEQAEKRSRGGVPTAQSTGGTSSMGLEARE